MTIFRCDGRVRADKDFARERWDPIGVNTNKCARDEYDSYAMRLLSMMSSGSSRDELERYLAWVETEYMGLNATDTHAAIADEALRIYGNAK
jgi:hypothetical protein